MMQVSKVYELPLAMVGEREACLGAALAIFDRCFSVRPVLLTVDGVESMLLMVIVVVIVVIVVVMVNGWRGRSLS